MVYSLEMEKKHKLTLEVEITEYDARIISRNVYFFLPDRLKRLLDQVQPQLDTLLIELDKEKEREKLIARRDGIKYDIKSLSKELAELEEKLGGHRETKTLWMSRDFGEFTSPDFWREAPHLSASAYCQTYCSDESGMSLSTFIDAPECILLRNWANREGISVSEGECKKIEVPLDVLSSRG